MLPVICLVIFSVGILLALPARGWDDALLERDLATVTGAIAEGETDLQEALLGYDERVITAIGTHLRDLKLRREKIVRDIAQAHETRSRAESAALARRRPGLLRQLEAIESQIDEAAAAFNQDPAPQRAARLRELSLRALELKDESAQADRALRADGEPPAAGDSPAAPTSPPGQAQTPLSPGGAGGLRRDAAEVKP